jgi:hypothetical protein
MESKKRTSITGSVRHYDTEKEEADSMSIMLETNSEGAYSISSDFAKNLFGSVMTAALRGTVANKIVAPAEQTNVKAVKSE